MSTHPQPDIGTRIRRLRELRGLTQGDLARKCRTHQSAISSLECGSNGRKNPSVRILALVARVLKGKLVIDISEH